MNSFNIRVIVLGLIVSSLALVHASSMAPTPKGATKVKTVYFRGLSIPAAASTASSPSPALSRFEEAVYGLKDPAVNSPLPEEYNGFFEEEHGLEEPYAFFQQRDASVPPVDLGSALYDGLCAESDSSCNRAAMLRILSYLIEKQTNRALQDANGRTLLDLCMCCDYEKGIEQLEQAAVDSTVRGTDGGKKSSSATTRAASAFGLQPSVYHHADNRPISQPVRAVSEQDLLGDAKDEKIAALEKVIEMLKQSVTEERAARLAVLKKQDEADKLASQNELLIKQLMREKKDLQEELREQGDCVRALQKHNVALQGELKKQQLVIEELQLDLATQRCLAPSFVSASTSGATTASFGMNTSMAPAFDTDAVVTVDVSALSQAAASSSSAMLSETPVAPALVVAHPTSPAVQSTSFVVSPLSSAAPSTTLRS